MKLSAGSMQIASAASCAGPVESTGDAACDFTALSAAA